MGEREITKRILNTIRENKEIKKDKLGSLNENNKQSNMITEFKKIVNKNLVKENNETFAINKNTPQFGDVRISQEEGLIKTIGENIELSENALVYKPDSKDLILTGKITALNLSFQFRYNDPSGDGCYIWANGLQLTDTNQRTIGKIRDAFVNWKSDLLQNGDLIEKLHKAATQE